MIKSSDPAAGLGTRFLPATKSMPKEMLPIMEPKGFGDAVLKAESGVHPIDYSLSISCQNKRVIK